MEFLDNSIEFVNSFMDLSLWSVAGSEGSDAHSNTGWSVNYNGWVQKKSTRSEQACVIDASSKPQPNNPTSDRCWV